MRFDVFLTAHHSELPYPTRLQLSRSFLEGGASCFSDALYRHIRVRRERSLHRR